jgi:hypothetical protein
MARVGARFFEIFGEVRAGLNACLHPTSMLTPMRVGCGGAAHNASPDA